MSLFTGLFGRSPRRNVPCALVPVFQDERGELLVPADIADDVRTQLEAHMPDPPTVVPVNDDPFIIRAHPDAAAQIEYRTVTVPRAGLRIRKLRGVVDDGRPTKPWVYSVTDQAGVIVHCKTAATFEEALACGQAHMESLPLTPLETT